VAENQPAPSSGGLAGKVEVKHRTSQDSELMSVDKALEIL